MGIEKRSAGGDRAWGSCCAGRIFEDGWMVEGGRGVESELR